MREPSEASRQIVEFEELVSRLDRINGHHEEEDKEEAQSAAQYCQRARRPSSASFPQQNNPPAPSLFGRELSGAADAPPLPCSLPVGETRRVRVNIGIDEDLRMILDMDPSIVDRQPSTPPPSSALVNTLRATRPQGW